MDIAFQLNSSTHKCKVFHQALLRVVYESKDMEFPLREAQQAGVDELETHRWSVSDSTITMWTRKLKRLGLLTYRKHGRAHIAVLTDDDKVLDCVEEFLTTDLDRQEEESRPELKIPIRVSKDRPLSKELWREYMKAFNRGEIDMAFIIPKGSK
jgi:hypothetical protein